MGISVNTSYNPENYEDHKVSMADMIKHLVMFYKYGGKQLYYFNTYDGAGELHEKEFKAIEAQLSEPVEGEDDCDSCKNIKELALKRYEICSKCPKKTDLLKIERCKACGCVIFI